MFDLSGMRETRCPVEEWTWTWFSRRILTARVRRSNVQMFKGRLTDGLKCQFAFKKKHLSYQLLLWSPVIRKLFELSSLLFIYWVSEMTPAFRQEGLSMLHTILPSSSQPFPKKQTNWSSFISWCGSLVHTKGGGAKTSRSSIRLVGIILTWEETFLLLHAVISASTAELKAQSRFSRCLCWAPERFRCRNSKAWSHVWSSDFILVGGFLGDSHSRLKQTSPNH